MELHSARINRAIIAGCLPIPILASTLQHSKIPEWDRILQTAVETAAASGLGMLVLISLSTGLIHHLYSK